MNKSVHTAIDAERRWDVAVVGGGPAGMMAALTAASKGKKVVLIEKNNSLGKKLLITGGGRCNVTNAEFDHKKLLAKFKEAEQFLFSAFSQWDVKSTLDFFHSRGLDTKIENEKRVFPITEKAQSVWNVLVEELKKQNVSVVSNAPVRKLNVTEDKVTSVSILFGNKEPQEIKADSFVIATGGTSRPETGSTGDGFVWLKHIGHKVNDPDPSLVPVAIKDSWVKKLQGITLTDIKISTFQNNAKQESNKGKLLFTHFGITGPTVLNMSKEIGELLKYGNVEVSIDLLPKEDFGTLNTRLQNLVKNEHKKKIKNALDSLIPKALIDIVLEKSQISPDTEMNSLSRESRITLMHVLKDLRMAVSGLLGADKAIVSSGGVDIREIDFKTMKSRLFGNLFLIGDIIDIDRPSGGYSLQLCWTTGAVAGNNA
jgi:predicted Rossmann fold flavoprotein